MLPWSLTFCSCRYCPTVCSTPANAPLGVAVALGIGKFTWNRAGSTLFNWAASAAQSSLTTCAPGCGPNVTDDVQPGSTGMIEPMLSEMRRPDTVRVHVASD